MQQAFAGTNSSPDRAFARTKPWLGQNPCLGLCGEQAPAATKPSPGPSHCRDRAVAWSKSSLGPSLPEPSRDPSLCPDRSVRCWCGGRCYLTYCCCSSHDSRLLLLLLWLLSWWRCGWCNYRRSTSPPLPLFPNRQSCPGPFLPLISPSIPFPPLPLPSHTYPSLPSLTSLCPLPSCQLPENVAQRKRSEVMALG